MKWILSKGKCIMVPLRSIEAHLRDRRYSSYSFLTSALEGGEWSASRPGRALPPDKEPPVPTVQVGPRAGVKQRQGSLSGDVLIRVCCLDVC
jgi:hypothetical protein